MMVKPCLQSVRHFGIVTVFLLGPAIIGFAQELPSPTPMWSVGPLTKGEPVMGVAFGAKGATFSGPRVDSQTGSIFSATRSIAFAGDRIVLVSKIGMRKVEGAQIPGTVYQILSLDAQTGKVKDSREVLAFASAQVIVSGRSVMRLTPDLKDAGSFDYHARGHKAGNVEGISPDGSTLGNATSPGLELVDSHT